MKKNEGKRKKKNENNEKKRKEKKKHSKPLNISTQNLLRFPGFAVIVVTVFDDILNDFWRENATAVSAFSATEIDDPVNKVSTDGRYVNEVATGCISLARPQISQHEAHDAMSCKTLQESISDTTVESQCEEPLQAFRIAAHPIMSRIGGVNPSVRKANSNEQ